MPPNAVKGVIREKTNGDHEFEGSFVTPGSPGGKDGSKLTDKEKQDLLKLFEEEKKRVDDLFSMALPKPAEGEYAANFDPTLMPVDVAVTLPEGLTATATAPAMLAHSAANALTLANGVATVNMNVSGSTALEPHARIEFATWDLGNGKRASGTSVRAVYNHPGKYTVRVAVADYFGSMGGAKFTLIVPLSAQPPSAMTELTPTAASPGIGTGTESGLDLPPVGGPHGQVFATVEAPPEQPSPQPGPQGVYIGVVDAQGHQTFYKAVTDALGHLRFALPEISGTVASVLLFRHFDKSGHPDQGATMQVNTGPGHVPDTLQLTNPPSNGPAITAANPAYDLGSQGQGLVALQTRNTQPLQTKILVDGSQQGVDTVAASDQSAVGRLHSTLALGRHMISAVSAGQQTNSFTCDVVTIKPGALPSPLKPGTVVPFNLTIAGLAPSESANILFEVGGAATLENGAVSAVEPVRNGVASRLIRLVRAGELRIKWTLQVMLPGFVY